MGGVGPEVSGGGEHSLNQRQLLVNARVHCLTTSTDKFEIHVSPESTFGRTLSSDPRSSDCCPHSLAMPSRHGDDFAELRRSAVEFLREHPGTEKVDLAEREGASSSAVHAWEVN